MKRNTGQLKEQLIQTGIDEIGKHGIEKLSLRTIAKACGVTHGTPYRHFESKEGYLKVVLARLSLFLNQEINENIDATGSARDQLTRLGLNFIIFAKTYPHFFEALFIKFPFKYMKVTQDTILLESDLPGFDKFKELVLDTPKNTERTHKFYEKAGFNKVSQEDLSIKYDHPYTDSDFFQLKLS